MDIHLITTDVGNVNLKFRPGGGAWVIEPSLVRTPGRQGYSFVDDTSAPRPLTYLGGPANIRPMPYLVGRDAARAGVDDLAMIGSAELRVRSDAYVLLHLYAILASLPPGRTNATIAFAGGLPVEDYGNRTVVEVLKTRLKGMHMLRWGDQGYQVTIAKILLVPQPIGAIATLLFTPEGQVITNGALLRRRFALDIGGGTTDFTGRQGLELIAGTEGGVRLGVADAAQRAAALIKEAHPKLRQLTAQTVLDAMQRNERVVYLQGEPLDVGELIDMGVRQTSTAILAQVVPPWERYLESGEVLLFGGGGALMAGPISADLAPLTRVTLLSNPLTRVAEGIERLGRNKLAG